MNNPAFPLNPVERFNLELLTRQYRRNVAILSGANAADAAPGSHASHRTAFGVDGPSGFDPISQGDEK